MDKKKIIIGLVITTAIVGASIWGYNKFKKRNLGSHKDYDVLDNFGQLKQNLGQHGIEDKDGKIGVLFNGGVNSATFYNNGRFFIFDKDKQKVAQGNYFNGGLTLTLEKKDPVESASVFNNLKNLNLN